MSGVVCMFCGGPKTRTGDRCSDRAALEIGRCEACGLVQVMSFAHVNSEYYASDTYFPEDTAPVYEREEHWNVRRIARLKVELPEAERRSILDFGCGVGGFLRRAQGQFSKVIGFDLSSRMVELHSAAGMPCVSRIEDVPADIDTIVLFHVLEHAVRPWELLQSLCRRFTAVDRVIVEVPNTDEALITMFGSQAYRRNHFSADHVYYFSNKTLRAVVERAGLRVLVDSQMQRYQLGNTFGWLAQGKGGGQVKWPWFNRPDLHDSYEAALAAAGAADSVFMICEPAR